MKLDKNKKLSTGEVGRLCGATTASVNNWIKGKKIKAYNTPGGQYRILVKDLIEFIRKNNMPIPEELKDFIKKRILIIDKDKSNTEFLKEIVKKINIEIEISVYKDEYDGLIAVGELKPDLIFLNIAIFKEKIFNIYESIKSNKALKITTIFIIDENDFSSKEKFYPYDNDEIIKKPLSISRLEEKLKKILIL